MNSKKTILVITYGPVPTPEFQTIEGGGMRCWGLAEGLRDNEFDVTVAVNEGFPQGIDSHESIKLINWRLDDNFIEILNSFDVVVVSYCMGDLSVFVADNISPKVTLVLDGYVPIFVEVSARDSKDLENEYRNYFADVARFNHVLRRGDYFLCANTPQKHMYMGVLGSLGVLNPRSYREHRILQVPFGISDPQVEPSSSSPYEPFGIGKQDFVLLWFGGLYPWFDFTPLLEAIEELTKTSERFKFVLVGAKNPYNNHPDFVSQANFVMSELTKRNLINKSCFVVDWVDFKRRRSWYEHASLVISINRPGEENAYSWRTRVMDYVWGGIPVLTNGGDPLSDYLISKTAAIKIETSSKSIVSTLKKLMSSQHDLDNARSRLVEIQRDFLWPKVVAPIVESMRRKPNPFDEERVFAINAGIKLEEIMGSTATQGNESALDKIQRYWYKAKEKGLRKSFTFAFGIIKTKLRYILSSKKQVRKAVLLSHPIDDTGAPLVLLEVAKDLLPHFGRGNVHLASPGIEKHLMQSIKGIGIVYHRIAEGIGGRIINAQLNIHKDDFVLMNTVALHENYKQYIFRLLENGRLNRATWFIHEDKPEIRLTSLAEISRIKTLTGEGKLDIVVPSKQTADEYNRYIGVSRVRAVSLRVDIPDELIQARPPDDFKSIRFVMSGTPSDGRKGQLLFLAALELAIARLRERNIEPRPLEVHFISIGDDYISEQIKAVATGLFADKAYYYPKMPRNEALAVSSKCNVTVCTSLNETFALYVAEGMMMGHPIIRNRTSGWHEQVKDGLNGLLIENLDLQDIAAKIADILDPSRLSDEQLASMSKASVGIAQKYRHSSYSDQLLPPKS